MPDVVSDTVEVAGRTSDAEVTGVVVADELSEVGHILNGDFVHRLCGVEDQTSYHVFTSYNQPFPGLRPENCYMKSVYGKGLPPGYRRAAEVQLPHHLGSGCT